MKTTELIKNRIETMPVGEPFTPAEFLSLGTRTAIDKTLARLVKAGLLMRVTRGVFVRPEESKYGKVPPSALKIAMAKANGAIVEVHGAEAVRRFGLSTQVQVQPVYYTSGGTKHFKLGQLPITLKHISPRKLVAPGTNVGLAISALWYLGKEQVKPNVFEAIKSKLNSSEFEELKQSASSMPAWMADALWKYERETRRV
jgi:Family of unknown function (DUF6088)